MGDRTLCLGSLMVLCCSATAIADGRGVSVVIPDAMQHDRGWAMALHDLDAALSLVSIDSTQAIRKDGQALPSGDLILLGRQAEGSAEPWQPPGEEAFRIQPLAMKGRRTVLIQGGTKGMMFGIFKLAEHIRVTGSPWQAKLDGAPAFPFRVFSEEGQLLDIPDIAYRAFVPPYANEQRLHAEVDRLKQLVDHIAKLGYNALAVMHVNFEEYIDYRYLDKQVYPQGDPHRQRSPVFCKYLSDLCDYAHARHIQVYLQVYEFQYPPQLAKLYRIDLDSPETEQIVRAKTRELFERVPLDGLIITATETNPRTGYLSKVLWQAQGRAGAGKMATLYHNACKAAGKRCIYRLWLIVKAAEHVPEVVDNAPPQVEMEIKHTGNDFYPGWPMTTALTSRLPAEQPLTVTFDTFREYDGWSRLFVYKKSWRERVRVCRDQKVFGINGWGPWAEQCISSDENGKKSWAGHWNQFRMFIDGFTPGQANAYLLARLAWNPDGDARTIARDFAALHVGPRNADAAAEALMLSEEPYSEYLLGPRGEIANPMYIKWTMVFRPQEAMLEEAYKRISPEEIYQSNARAFDAVRKMEEAFARTDPAKAAHADSYARFATGIEKTALYIRTLYLWRELWWRHRADRDLVGDAKSANAVAKADTKARLEELFRRWGRFPEEARYWRITFQHGLPPNTPDDSFLRWYFKGAVTMQSTAALY